MDTFEYRDGRLYCENLAVDEVVEHVGSPVYIYSRRSFEYHHDALARAFGQLAPMICYSVKSCGNLHLLKLLAARGAGMDVVSGGELYRARLAGVEPSKIAYAGVGKTDAEIQQAVASNIGWFNIESEQEFDNIARLAARLGARARGALRINPDVADPATHAKTTTGKKQTKFGVDIDRARRVFDACADNGHCSLRGVHLHIGSPIYSPEPYVRAIRKALDLIADLRSAGHRIDAINIGGGYAADYESHRSPSYDTYAGSIVPLLRDSGLKVILEPGRTIAGNSGVLACRVQYTKEGGGRRFAVVDTGMHHLLRPALYDAQHFIWPTRVGPALAPPRREVDMAALLPGASLETVDVVGPICETGDVLAKGRALPRVERGDTLAIFTAGAYGMAMASNYNAQPRPAEVLVDEGRATLIRRRETYQDLVAAEQEAERITL